MNGAQLAGDIDLKLDCVDESSQIGLIVFKSAPRILEIINKGELASYLSRVYQPLEKGPLR